MQLGLSSVCRDCVFRRNPDTHFGTLSNTAFGACSKLYWDLTLALSRLSSRSVTNTIRALGDLVLTSWVSVQYPQSRKLV